MYVSCKLLPILVWIAIIGVAIVIYRYVERNEEGFITDRLPKKLRTESVTDYVMRQYHAHVRRPTKHRVGKSKDVVVEKLRQLKRKFF